jgi:hypothetical protein
MSSELMNQLVKDHPDACALIVKILQAIDNEKRNLPGGDIQLNEEFCLSTMSELVGDTIDEVSPHRNVSIEAEHALRIMWDFFVDFESAGIVLESNPRPQKIIYADGHAEAIALMKANPDAKFFEVEIGFFNVDINIRNHYNFEVVYVAADDAISAEPAAIEFAKANWVVPDNIRFHTISEVCEIDRKDLNWDRAF